MRQALRKQLKHFPFLEQRLISIWRKLSPIPQTPRDYIHLQEQEAISESGRLRDAWQSQSIPGKQRVLVDAQLKDYRRGNAIAVFDVLVEALRALPVMPKMTVLEVGCSSGYYSEVMRMAGLECEYAGCDYSDAFVAMAKERYPGLRFDVEDATCLGYADRSFDVVISGCCLLHIPDYALAVAEAARVARRYVVFHRTPVVLGQADMYYRKQAYGVETVEIHFNEPSFLGLLKQNGLNLIATYTLSESLHDGVGSASRTYVCEKAE